MKKKNIEQQLQLVKQHAGLDVEWINNIIKKSKGQMES